jgi:hypothetical protein
LCAPPSRKPRFPTAEDETNGFKLNTGKHLRQKQSAADTILELFSLRRIRLCVKKNVFAVVDGEVKPMTVKKG